jgi:hypothetical protein
LVAAKEGTNMAEKAKWTIMVYMAGDNNLSDAGEIDLAEMRRVGSSGDVHVVAEFDNAGDRGTNRYYIKSGSRGEQVISLGETDSGDPKVLVDFITWAAGNYRAERYALILWNHGGGWEPAEIDRVARPIRPRDYSIREASHRSSSSLGRMLFRTGIERIFKHRSPRKRAICSDDGSGHSLDTVELGNVLAKARKVLDQPLDILGLDACLMSNFEVAYQSQGYVRYLVASEESEPDNGWPYDRVLRRVVDSPQIDTDNLAEQIVTDYVKSYADRKYSVPVTQSALDLSKIEQLTGPLDKLADTLIARMPKVSREIFSAQRDSARFWNNTLWDISSFCEALENRTSSKAVRMAAQDVRAAAKPGAGQLVVAESHAEKTANRYGGVSIYLMPPLTPISEYYKDLKFAKQHRWLPMLKAYHSHPM